MSRPLPDAGGVVEALIQDLRTCEPSKSLNAAAADLLASLSPRAGEEGDQGLRASRDHAPRAGVALDWERQGDALFSYVQDGWRKGEPVLVNRIWVRVEHDRHYATPEEAGAVMDQIHAALSSATLNVGDKSRDEQSPKAPAKLEGES
jgi:hypothetical protein